LKFVRTVTVQQIVDRLVVNLDVRTLDLELDRLNSLIVEHCLVVQRLVCTLSAFLLLVTGALLHPLLLFSLDLCHLTEEVFKASREQTARIAAFPSLYCERFTTSSLTVSEDAAVKALKAKVDNRFTHLLKNFELGGLLARNVVERELVIWV